MTAVFIPRAGGESHRPQMCHGWTQEDGYCPPLMSQGEAGSVSPPLTGSSTELRLTGTVGCGSPRRWAGGAQLCRPLLPKGCAQLTSAWTRGREALSPHRTRGGGGRGEHSVAPLQQEGCVGFTAPGGCGSRSRTAAALRPARSSVVSHGPTAPRRDSCALTQRRRLPRIPPPYLPPPPQNPTGIPGAKREAARRWCGAGGIRDGWELPQPKVLPPPCAGGRGGKGARDVPVGARGTPLCPLELGGPIGVRRVGAAGWGHFGNGMGTPYRDASRLSPTDTGSGDTSW